MGTSIRKLGQFTEIYQGEKKNGGKVPGSMSALSFVSEKVLSMEKRTLKNKQRNPMDAEKIKGSRE